jgi:hypothetical protein
MKSQNVISSYSSSKRASQLVASARSRVTKNAISACERPSLSKSAKNAVRKSSSVSGKRRDPDRVELSLPREQNARGLDEIVAAVARRSPRTVFAASCR